MDLCWQSDVSAFKHALYVWHSFPSKEQASFNFMVIVTISSDFGAEENKICHCFHFFSIYLHELTGRDAMIFLFWMLSFKPDFSLLFSPLSRGSLLPLQFWPLKWYHLHLRLLIFLPAISILACDSSSLPFHIMYSPCKLNKRGDNI